MRDTSDQATNINETITTYETLGEIRDILHRTPLDNSEMDFICCRRPLVGRLNDFLCPPDIPYFTLVVETCPSLSHRAGY